MKLKCHRFDLSIKPLTKVGPEGWLNFQVDVTVPGFGGNFEAELQLEDLERFKDGLNEMQESIGKEHEVFLSSAEPGIYIALKSDKLGNIQAEYVFESDRYDGEPTSLSGAFAIDQTYLKPLIGSVSEDIKRITDTKAVTNPSEVTQLTLGGSINEAEQMAMELLRTATGCTIRIRMVGRALYDDVVQEDSSEVFDNLVRQVLDTGVLATQSFQYEGPPICDGDQYLVKISTREGCISRQYYCPDEANDPKINEVTSLIKKLVHHFEPKEWEYISAYVEREELMERGDLQNDGRIACQQLRKRLEHSGLECPHCKRHTKRMKFFARQSCFVCLECGSSFGPAR